MLSRRVFTVLLAVIAAFSVCVFSQRKIDAIRSGGSNEEMLYLPNEKLLTHFTAGLSSVVADMLWLKTIQYTVQEFHNPERKFTWLNHMCNTVTRLDPYYADVYTYGGMLLAAIGADENAMELLKRGAVVNPDEETIPFEMAKIWLLNRYKEPNAEANAIPYLHMVAERSEEHADFYLKWTASLQAKHTPGEGARALWEDILRTAEDDIIVEIAQNNLMQITIDSNVATIEKVVEKYEEQVGTRPASLEDLISAGVLKSLPSDLSQGRYFIDHEGQVRNSLLVEKEVVRMRTWLNNEMQRYRAEKERFPFTLHEWSAWADHAIPAHPDGRTEWRYDSETGAVN